MEIEIAILDNEVTEPYKKDLSNYVCLNDNDNNGKCEKDVHNFPHANIIYIIVRRYAKDSSISSVKILDYKGKGEIKKLNIALEWCYKKNIKIVNLSFGSTSFIDRKTIKEMINYYTNKGLIIISAVANSGYTSYPAYYSNVIGVTSSYIWHYKKLNRFHHGIDYISDFNDKICLDNGMMLGTNGSNSYIAPYVTSMVYHILRKNSNYNTYQIKQELMNSTQEIKKNNFYDPDWIENAYCTFDLPKSKAKYYFTKLYDAASTYSSIKDNIDTIILHDVSELNRFAITDKKIIILNDKLNEGLEEVSNFNWTKFSRISQINKANKALEIDVPIVLCKISKLIDHLWFLQELQRLFYKELYNPYIASTRIESILYDIEYIPIESFNNSKKLKQFLAGESFYKKQDMILLASDNEKLLHQYPVERDIPLIIYIEKNLHYSVELIYQNKKVNQSYTNMNAQTIESIYYNIKKILS